MCLDCQRGMGDVWFCQEAVIPINRFIKNYFCLCLLGIVTKQMNCRQKLGSEVAKGDLRISYLFTHAQWAICGPQRLLYVDDRHILDLPLELHVIGVTGVDEWGWEHYWSWGNLPAVHSRPGLYSAALLQAPQLCNVSASCLGWHYAASHWVSFEGWPPREHLSWCGAPEHLEVENRKSQGN